MLINFLLCLYGSVCVCIHMHMCVYVLSVSPWKKSDLGNYKTSSVFH